MSDLRRLTGYLTQHRAALAGAIAAALLAAVFFASAVSLVNPFLAALAPGAEPVAPGAWAAAPGKWDDKLPGWALGAKRQVQQLIAPAMDWMLARAHVRVPLVIVALYALKALFFFIADYTFRRVGLLATAWMREELYTRALQQSDAFYMRHSSGEMISRILNDVSRLQAILGSDIGQMLQSGPAALAMLLVAVGHAWQVTLLCLVAIPVFGFAASRFGRRVKKAARRSQEQTASLVAHVGEALIGRRVVQAHRAEQHEIDRFGGALRRALRQDLRVARTTSATPAVMEIIGVISGALLLVFAGVLTRSGAVDGKNVFVAVLALGVVFTHVRRLGQLNNAVQQALASARRVFEVLDEPIVIRDAEDARPLEPFRREIRFDAVCFAYGRGPVLAGIDLVVRAGEVHALVGPSGAGKSTLAMLIPRFIDPTAGRVTIDGVDLRSVTVESLRGQIALVTQDTHLFDDTVRANIAYAAPDADPAAIEAAARAAFADEFIRQLPEGYDTPLGERGSQLSAGQRQRLAIARAFLKNCPILILDEATSALDSASEREVQRALEALLAGRTALIIAHRLSTVARADRIHVLENGHIVESGSHAELLARGGAYARLHEFQQT